MNDRSRLLFVAASLTIAIYAGSASGQSTADVPIPPAEPIGPPSLVQSVEPSFRIEPVVHRFKGRRGEVIPFKFSITSLGGPMDVAVKMVNLRQELSGIILHDAHREADKSVRLDSPKEFRIEPGKVVEITGSVAIPLAKTNYLSYGLLVQDKGQAPDFEDLDKTRETRAGIRFVTQYVLRVDVETGVADIGAMRSLRFEEGGVQSENGFPIAHTILYNPTNFAFECQVRADVSAKSRPKNRPFLLGMASRAELTGADKYLVRIMPKSRIRLQAPVSTALFPGEQRLSVGLSNGRREVSSSDFAFNVRDGDFPALDSQLAFIGNQLTVNPAQVELGTAKGSKRMVALRISNNSPIIQTVSIDVNSLSGRPLEGLRMLCDVIVVKPGRTKSIRLTASGGKGDESLACGVMTVSATSEEGTKKARDLPLIVRHGNSPTPNLSVSEIELVREGQERVFRVLVTNTESMFVPIYGRLSIADQQGRSSQLTAGYGKWLNPGEVSELLFTPKWSMPPGEYQLSLQLKTFGDVAPRPKRSL